jgi:serine/threonine-protein kinase
VLRPGELLGAYKLIDRIGAGGMGEVWKAEDPRLGRIVAIKILPPAVASDAEAMLRMQREARTAAQLYHPNIATIHSIEEHDGRLFIVMEYVQGEPLTKLIAARRLSEADVCRIGRGVADALAESHEHGIIHRDIKPDNIVVNGARVKVLDFGIAKRIGLETTSSDAPTAFVTQQGMIVGTVHYMSPEQALGKPLDARTDIFSLGIVLYEAVSGKLPFAGETITETITQIVRDEPPAIANATPGMRAIIERCLRKSRDERFASAADLGAALDALQSGASTELYTAPTVVRPIPPAPVTVVERKPRRSLAWLWIAIAVLVVGGLLWAARQKPKAVPVAAAAAAPKPAPAQAVVTVVDSAPAQEPSSGPSLRSGPPSPAAAGDGQPRPSPAAAGEGPRSGGEGTPAPPPTPQANPYDAGMASLAAGNPSDARQRFREAVDLDPNNAKAHFRLGEIAMFNRNFDHARDELRKALERREQLDPRERELAVLCMAISSGERMRAQLIGRDLNRRYPNDPELMRIRDEFAGEEQPFAHRRRPR